MHLNAELSKPLSVWVSGCERKRHISLVRENPDGTKTPLTMPNHPRIKASTLRTICTQAGITREEFLKAYDQS
jgi:hypothetical protein